MEPYNFWQDFFDTYQSLSDWMKMLWLIVPPAFALGALWLGLDYRLKSRSAAPTGDGALAYTVFADETGVWRIHAHQDAEAVAGALQQALEQREELRFQLPATVADRTWDACAERVEALWSELA